MEKSIKNMSSVPLSHLKTLIEHGLLLFYLRELLINYWF